LSCSPVTTTLVTRFVVLITDPHTEETIYPSYSPSTFDFDTIYSMFPTRNASNSNIQFSGDVTLDEIPNDPLFGLMDEPMLPFTDMTDTFFNGSTAF